MEGLASDEQSHRCQRLRICHRSMQMPALSLRLLSDKPVGAARFHRSQNLHKYRTHYILTEIKHHIPVFVISMINTYRHKLDFFYILVITVAARAEYVYRLQSKIVVFSTANNRIVRPWRRFYKSERPIHEISVNVTGIQDAVCRIARIGTICTGTAGGSSEGMPYRLS